MSTTTPNASRKKIARRKVAVAQREVTAALAEGSESLGAIVFWSSLEGVRIKRDVFRGIFQDAGLGAALGRDPKPEACLNRAALYASLATSQGYAKGRKAPIRVEMKTKDDTHAIYSVLVRNDMSDGRVRYIEEARIICERWVSAPSLDVVINPKASENPERDAVIDTVLDRYDEILNYALTSEMSKTLINAMKIVSALTLRTGVYFVPESNEGMVTRLREALAREAGLHVSSWSISRTSDNLLEARRDACAAMRDRLNELQRSAQELIDETPEGEELAPKKLAARMRHLIELESDAALYTDILGSYASELQVSLAKARAALGGSVAGLFEDPE